MSDICSNTDITHISKINSILGGKVHCHSTINPSVVCFPPSCDCSNHVYFTRNNGQNIRDWTTFKVAVKNDAHQIRWQKTPKSGAQQLQQLC